MVGEPGDAVLEGARFVIICGRGVQYGLVVNTENASEVVVRGRAHSHDSVLQIAARPQVGNDSPPEIGRGGDTPTNVVAGTLRAGEDGIAGVYRGGSARLACCVRRPSRTHAPVGEGADRSSRGGCAPQP